MKKTILVVVASMGLICAVFYICSMTGYDKDLIVKEDKVSVIAHRGASGYCPENSLASIKKALEMNANGIEIDVRLTRDGVVVLMHDETIGRTTTGTGTVIEIDYSELRSFDAGSWYDNSFSGEHVPTLDETITLIDGRAELLIEIKDDNGSNIAHKVVDIINQYQAAGWCRVISFNDEILWAIRDYDQSIKLCKLFIGKIPCLPFYVDHGVNNRELDEYGFVSAIGMNERFLTQKQIVVLKQEGFELIVWTVNDKDKAKELVEMGADAIISDYPDILLEK